MTGDFISDKSSNVSNWWLSRVLDFLSSGVVNSSNIIGLLNNIISLLTSINNKLTWGSVILKHGYGSDSNNLGTINISTLKSIMIKNTGGSNIKVENFTVKPDETLSIAAEFVAYLGPIRYDCTGSSMEYLYTYV